MESTVTYLDEEGVLADNLEVFAQNVRDKYARWLAEARAHNRVATTAQFSIQVHRESAQELCCSALYVRVLVYTQTALLLVERGLTAPVRVMLRCAVEALFNLRACARDSKTALTFLDADLVSRKKTGEYLQQVTDASLKRQIAGEHVAEHLKTLADEIEALDAKKLQTRQLARLAGLEDWYLTTYAHLSSSVHSTARDLEEYFEVDVAGDVAGLVNEPSDRGLELLITLAVETQSLALEAVSKVFNLVLDPAGEAHLKTLQALNVPDTSG
jgi:hypothetical protein